MLLVHYRETGAAEQAAASAHSRRVQVELVVRVNADGRIQVADPAHGVRAFSCSDLVSWGGFGVVVGGIAGAVEGGGLVGVAGGALVTGLVWGLFGLAAGALYGLSAGRAVSGRRLSGLRRLLVPNSSNVLAWIDGPALPEDLATLNAPGSERLVLRFVGTRDGTVITSG
jgi:hypothetical protein